MGENNIKYEIVDGVRRWNVKWERKEKKLG